MNKTIFVLLWFFSACFAFGQGVQNVQVRTGTGNLALVLPYGVTSNSWLFDANPVPATDLASGTSAGVIVFSNTVTLDQLLLGGSVNAQTFSITNLSTGTGSANAATKGYVDSQISSVPSYRQLSISTTGTTTITKSSSANSTQIVDLTLGAGSGLYVSSIVLSTTLCNAGDQAQFHTFFPASPNPSLAIYSGSTSGSQLFSWSGSVSFITTLTFTFNGTTWEY